MKYVTAPKWFEAPPVKPPWPGVEPSLADVESHMPNGHPYKDNRHITWCHETTHGLNGNLRNQRVELFPAWNIMTTEMLQSTPYRDPQFNQYKLPRPAGPVDPTVMLGAVNAFYLLGNRAVRLNEPSGIKLSTIANAVPQPLRGMSYQLYLVQQRQYWENEPLYVHDEWSAYLNGLTTGLEGKGRDGSYSDVLQPLEFMGYCCCLLRLAIEKGYDAAEELRNLTAYQAARSLMLLKMSDGVIDNSQAKQYVAAFNQEFAEDLKVWCGLSWYNAVYEGRDFYGVF